MASENVSDHSEVSKPSSRGKTDPTWKHCQEIIVNGKSTYKCCYCSNTYRGGGINRMKQHLAGKKGQVASCVKVPPAVRELMISHLKVDKKTVIKRALNEFNEDPFDMEEEEVEVEELNSSKLKESMTVGKGKGKVANSSAFLVQKKSSSGTQPGIRSVMAGKEAKGKACLALCKWFYDACIPFNAINSPYFKLALDAMLAIGPGFQPPSYHDLRVNYLSDCKKECALVIDSYKADWEKFGCTIMADGWSDRRQRTLINILVYSPRGTCFLKSIDASDVVKDAQTLSEMLLEVIEWVGPTNVVHVVTDNAANYQAAGKLIHKKYDNIFWSPCAAHCINLILKDIAGMNHVSNLAFRASKVTIFIYNHMIFLSWLRKREGWKEIVRPAVTRFATTFITLSSILEHKSDLQALVISPLFTTHKLSKSAHGKVVSSTVLDKAFWDEIEIVVHIAGPLIRLLRIVDSDERPSLPYVYDGIRRARKIIKHMFKKKKDLYEPFITLIDKRWDKHFKRSLHVSSYFLNPAFQYGEKFCKKPEVKLGLLQMLEKKSICEHGQQATQDIALFEDQLESFGRKFAISGANTMRPDNWWKTFGISSPTLQKFAIRILSQTASSSGCERNWSLFERIHTKKRNRLEHGRLNDLVYVNSNLRLSKRCKKYNVDPIDHECIEKTDFWIEEDSEVLDGQDMDEANIEENNPPPIVQDDTNEYGVSSFEENLEDVNLDLFNPFITINPSTHHFFDPSSSTTPLFPREANEN